MPTINIIRLYGNLLLSNLRSTYFYYLLKIQCFENWLSIWQYDSFWLHKWGVEQISGDLYRCFNILDCTNWLLGLMGLVIPVLLVRPLESCRTLPSCGFIGVSSPQSNKQKIFILKIINIVCTYVPMDQSVPGRAEDNSLDSVLSSHFNMDSGIGPNIIRPHKQTFPC